MQAPLTNPVHEKLSVREAAPRGHLIAMKVRLHTSHLARRRVPRLAAL